MSSGGRGRGACVKTRSDLDGASQGVNRPGGDIYNLYFAKRKLLGADGRLPLKVDPAPVCGQ